MRGLVIGAGYVGSACIAEWPNENDTFTATTTRKERIAKLETIASHVEVVNINNREKLAELLDDADFAIICVAPKDRAKYAETYLETAQAVSQALQERKHPLYLLYTSSTSVYGDHQGKDVDASSPLLANSENGRVLIETENCYLKISNDYVDVCILRLGGIYGPGRDILNRARRMSGKKIAGKDFPTNNSPLDLIVKGIAHCVKNRVCGVRNLVENSHPTKQELYESLLKKLNLPPPVWTEPHQGGAVVSTNLDLLPVSRAGRN